MPQLTSYVNIKKFGQKCVLERSLISKDIDELEEYVGLIIILPEKSMYDMKADREIKRNTRQINEQYKEALAAATNRGERDTVKDAYTKDVSEMESSVKEQYMDAFLDAFWKPMMKHQGKLLQK